MLNTCLQKEKNHHYGRKFKVPNKITTILKMYFKSLSLISCFWNANHSRNLWTLLYSKLLTLSCYVNLGFPASRAWDKILVQEVEKCSQEVGVCVWWEWDRTRLKAKTRCLLKFVIGCRSCFFPNLSKFHNEIHMYSPEILASGIFIFWLLCSISGLSLAVRSAWVLSSVT